MLVPARAGDEAEGVRREVGALVELEHLQHVAARADEHSDVLVGDGHAAQVDRLEALERRGELGVGSPGSHGGSGHELADVTTLFFLFLF